MKNFLKSNPQNYQFSLTPQITVGRSRFFRPYNRKMTFDCNKAYPVLIDEVLPGDTHIIDIAHLTRISTPIAPVMDNLQQNFYAFFVPSRLLWKNWERFCGAQDNPGDSIDYLIPTINSGESGFSNGSLADYFGIPTDVANLEVNALPFRAYDKIFNDWFRVEALQDSRVFSLDDGPDTTTDISLFTQSKQPDYFTTCQPYPQKGSVTIPLGGQAPLHFIVNPTIVQSDNISSDPVRWDMNGPNVQWSNATITNERIGTTNNVNLISTDGVRGAGFAGGSLKFHAGQVGGLYANNQNLNDNINKAYADIGSVNPISINELREAFQMQRYLERCARTGCSRYVEYIQSMYGVHTGDYRLQRAEYLGGFSSNITISPVPQTSASDTTSPQGNLSAFGHGGNVKRIFSHSFVDHGYLMILTTVRGDLTTTQQGLNRMWSRKTRFDFYNPIFAHLGEQAVLNKEIYAQGTTDDEGVFGYQERWSEYKYKPNEICGQMRSNYNESLDIWHYAQDYSSLPTLSDSWIKSDTPIKRTTAVPSYPDLIMDCAFRIESVRPIPTYCVPGLIDHF